MSPTINSCSLTDTGCLRDNNEDSYLANPDIGLWIVADGMGGHAAGEVASAIVIQSLSQSVQNHATLSEAIQDAHQAVLEGVLEGLGQVGMGSTVVALYNHGHNYEIAWVGDSRAYLWSACPGGGELQRLTKDHSYVQALIDRGLLEPENVSQHPDRNVITQCLGSGQLSRLQIDRVTGNWQHGQRLILCSDGLTNEVNDQKIADIMCISSTSNEAASQLLKAALDNGGQDNVTVQVIEAPADIQPNPIPAEKKQTTLNFSRSNIIWLVVMTLCTLAITATLLVEG